MRPKLLTFLMLLLAAAMPAAAYDFYAGNLCYDINDDGTSVTVVSAYGELSGALNIPSSVTNGGKTYTVTKIGSYAFNYCTTITSLTIPNSVTYISGNCFSGCTGLTSVTFGNSVEIIGALAFRNCSGLKSLTIPNSVRIINFKSFENCTGLTSLTIGNSVSSIQDTAFDNCTGLTTVNWNATNCNDFSRSPFSGFTNIKTFNFGNTVAKIPAYICNNLTGLTSVTIGNSVTSIGSNAFKGCTGLTKVDLRDLAKWCNIDFDSNTDNPLYYAKDLYLNGTKITHLSIPSSVTSIKQYAFVNCTSITQATIPSAVTSIGQQAYYGCTGLNRVNISDIAAWCNIDFGNFQSNPLYYAQNLYLNGTKVTHLSIPSSVTSIKQYAFVNCTSITQATIPSTVTSIGQHAYFSCAGLNRVNISDIAAWCNIDFGNSQSNPLYCAQNLYLNGTKVTDLLIPNSTTNIKQYSFYNCTPLTSVTIPNSVTTIEDYAFGYCSGINVLTIPNSVTTIGYSPFTGCTALMSIRSKIISPQNVTNNHNYSTFNGVPRDLCTVYIPVGTLSDYQATSPWSSFTHFVEVDYALIDRLDVNGDGWVSTADATILYDYMLNENDTDFPQGDVDGDGYITSADITAIYNMLLGM